MSLDSIILNFIIYLTIVPIIIYGVILYYIYKLEKIKCNCIINEFDFKIMKYLLILNIK